jgi:predicted TIM-barrel fold metal-dependent hydrolase
MFTQSPLFDANGSFGKPAAGGADFPTIASRLAFMDRLGIARSLVWNTEAQQHNALSANRKLLDEVAQTPGAAGRIVPSLVLSPLTTYERDGIATLQAQMDEGRTRSLRFVNVFGRLGLMQCEPVVRAIRDRKPFITVAARAVPAQDLLDFTELFPDVPVVITTAMWGEGIGVCDLMRRRKNILLENSWWHTWEGVGLVARQFGVERVLFGTGSRSHAGAAIAALARSGLSESDRALIGHGTLDRLTGLCTSARPAPAPGKLWQRFLAGERLGVEVVDAHGHLGPSGGYVLEHQSEAAQVPVALSAMEALGEGAMIMSGLEALLGDAVKGNEMLEEILRPHPGRFLGYVGFNPYYAEELLPRLDRWFAGNFFVGFKLLCSYWGTPVTDARFKPMWQYANARRLPILLHTWEGGMDSPAMLRDIVRQYPEAAFLLGHSGGSNKGRAEAEALAMENRNVYLEWCGSFCSTTMWEDTLKRVSPAQVVYGSDAMAHGIDWELGRLLSADISDETMTPMLGGNMRRILALRPKA